MLLHLLLSLHVLLPAEELPTLSFLSLAMTSDEIWEAEPLYFDSTLTQPERTRVYDTRWLRVRVTRVLRGRLFDAGDTVWVNTGMSYNWPHDAPPYNRRYSQTPDTLSRLLLFSRGYTAEQFQDMYGIPSPQNRPLWVALSLSGIRLCDRQGNVYYPFQHENPGGYHFYRDTSARWPAQIDRAACDIRRVDTLFALRAIENPREQNDSLLAWIRQHEAELRDRYHPDSWEWYRDLPFNWILSNNIHAQAWDAVLLHRRLFPDEILGRAEWSELGELPVPFRDVEGLKFLLGKIGDPNLEPALRDAAMRFFSVACQDNDLPETERTFLFREIQTFYPEIAEDHRLFCIYAASGLAFDYDGHKRVPDALPFFIEARQREAPGYLRNTIAEIIARQSTAEAWQAVSGNEGRVLVTLSNFYHDSVKQTIRFGFHQAAGMDGLYEHPVLELFQTDSVGREINRREMLLPVFYPKVDWANATLRSHGAAEVNVPAGDLPHGEWHFRARGTAGEQRQYRWVSEPAVFRF